MRSIIILFIISILLFSNCQNAGQQATKSNIDLNTFAMCGSVQFEDGCSPQLDSLISYGLALVHHMTYEDAEMVFVEVARLDPDCFWGQWGQAMTYIHPLWPDQPTGQALQKGLVLSERALELAKSEREKYFGEALVAYYRDGTQKQEKERLTAFESGWRNAVEARPDDIEAELFHVLTSLSILSPTESVEQIRFALGQRAEATLLKIPDHPGGFHYAIHSYDFPTLAHHAERVAGDYGKIAPEIPHALHMPSHIFTRLGHWQESIDWNYRSAKAALKMPVGDLVSSHYFHALDYLTYAYLQQGDIQNAQSALPGIDTLTPSFQLTPATAYALAAIPARLALENDDWEKATHLSLRGGSKFTWDKYPAYQALNYYGMGIGSARSGDLQKSTEALRKLDSLKTVLTATQGNQYWIGQIDIQRTVVEAWQKLAEGKKNEALELMHKAADIEDATDKNPVTPGELLPARELLADMYMVLDEPGEASKHYQKCLTEFPNRLKSMYGAGYAEEVSGNKEMARSFYQKILASTIPSASGHSKVVHAKEYLAQSS